MVRLRRPYGACRIRANQSSSFEASDRDPHLLPSALDLFEGLVVQVPPSPAGFRRHQPAQVGRVRMQGEHPDQPAHGVYAGALRPLGQRLLLAQPLRGPVDDQLEVGGDAALPPHGQAVQGRTERCPPAASPTARPPPVLRPPWLGANDRSAPSAPAPRPERSRRPPRPPRRRLAAHWLGRLLTRALRPGRRRLSRMPGVAGTPAPSSRNGRGPIAGLPPPSLRTGPPTGRPRSR